MNKILNRLFSLKQTNYQKRFIEDLTAMNYGPGDNYNTSGEKQVAEYIKNSIKDNRPTIFDIGANVGGYTSMLSKIWNEQAIIHCFEPSSKTFNQLIDNTKGLNNIIYNNIGCSDIEHTMPLYSYSNLSGLSSVYNRNLSHVNLKMDDVCTASFTTIDNYCKKNDIKHIHFLKMDVEGHELSVLQGAQKMLSGDSIDFIQFEFGGCNIDSRTFFKDFFCLLHEKYNIFRILKNGLYEITQYSEYCEIFVTVNYLAQLRKK